MRNYLMGNLKPDKDGHCNTIFFLSTVAAQKPDMAQFLTWFYPKLSILKFFTVIHRYTGWV